MTTTVEVRSAQAAPSTQQSEARAASCPPGLGITASIY